jgi:protein SCO1
MNALRPTRTLRLAGLLGLTLALSAPGALAIPESPGDKLIKEVDIVESLNEPVPADAVFTDQDGKRVRLGDFLDSERPVVLVLAYYRCPMLCSLVLGGLVKGMLGTGLELGKDYRALTVSIDPREGAAEAAERQRGYLQSLGKPDAPADWPFWVGEAAEIDKLAGAVGFRYRFDKETDQYAHAAALVVLTPDGRVSRYLYGLEFPPRDLKLALLEAADGKVGTSFDRVLLQCFRYDPATRRYEFFISSFIQGGALLVFFALAGGLALLWRGEFKRGSVK